MNQRPFDQWAGRAALEQTLAEAMAEAGWAEGQDGPPGPCDDEPAPPAPFRLRSDSVTGSCGAGGRVMCSEYLEAGGPQEPCDDGAVLEATPDQQSLFVPGNSHVTAAPIPGVLDPDPALPPAGKAIGAPAAIQSGLVGISKGPGNFDVQAAAFAGLLYDFAGYLTTREPAFLVGSTEDPTPVIDALVAFAAKRGLSLAEANVQHWQQALPGDPAAENDQAVQAMAVHPAEVLLTVAKLPDGRGKR